MFIYSISNINNYLNIAFYVSVNKSYVAVERGKLIDYSFIIYFILRRPRAYGRYK